MKIVVIGGTGLVGAKLVSKLRQLEHNVAAASPSSGFNSLTGEGLDEIFNGADVVVDVSAPASLEDRAILDFFQTSGRNVCEAARRARVKHHIVLSIVGAVRLKESAYFKGRLIQEDFARNSGIPYTIVRSTQFFEFLDRIADAGTYDGTVYLSPAFIQPIASEDAAQLMVSIVLSMPRYGIIELAGPSRSKLSYLMTKYFNASGDKRKVILETNALYFGSKLEEYSLIPCNRPRLGTIGFKDWMASRTSAAT